MMMRRDYMGETPVLIRMSGEIRREVHYPEPPGVVTCWAENVGEKRSKKIQVHTRGH
jgi:hypothetical protein